MRRALIVLALLVVSSGAGFWLGQRHANRFDTKMIGSATLQADHVVIGDVIRGLDKAAGLNSLTVNGDLHMRSLPDGKLALEGNLNVSPFSN